MLKIDIVHTVVGISNVKYTFSEAVVSMEYCTWNITDLCVLEWLEF